jgi:hypothetical protein
MTAGVSNVVLWISLTMLWVLVQFFYVDYRVDYFRQTLFDLRAALFDMALRGEVEFDSPAYWTLRTTLNGFLRDAARFNMVSVVCLLNALRSPRIEEESEALYAEWTAQLSKLPEDTQRKISEIRTAMHVALTRQVVMASPLSLLLLFPLLLLAFCAAVTTDVLKPATRKAYMKCAGWVRTMFLSPLDMTALELGQTDTFQVPV